MQDIAKQKLVLVPFSTEVKDKYWTTGRAVAVKQSTVQCKTLALDGRLHWKPPATGEEKKTFSIFWTIPRVQKKSDANLLLEWASVHVSTSVSLPCKRKYEANPVSKDIQVPVLVNPQKIPEHTQLFAMDDIALQKVAVAKEGKACSKAAKK